MRFVSLDDEPFRQLAHDDPHGFVRGQEPVWVDEIERGPGRSSRSGSPSTRIRIAGVSKTAEPSRLAQGQVALPPQELPPRKLPEDAVASSDPLPATVLSVMELEPTFIP